MTPRSRVSLFAGSPRSALSALAVLGVLASPAPARAADDVGAEAEALFRAGKKLMDEGDYTAACPKLAESQRLDPGNGTLARLATCHEKEGKVATAWSEFTELVTSAQRAGQADREKFARQHVAALQPRLSRLTIDVPAEVAALPGMVVRRDGVAVGPAAWGVAVPLDPGDHSLEAVATGRVPWSAHVRVGGENGRTAALDDITIPSLVLAPAPAPVASVPSPAAAPGAPLAEAERPSQGKGGAGGSQRTWGVIAAAAGLVAIGAGTYFGVRAIAKAHDANGTCPNSACGSAAAVSESGDAKTSARVADVFLPVGAAAVLAGSLLYFLAPRGTYIEPAVGSRSAGVEFQSSW